MVALVGNKADDIERQEVGKKESENLFNRLGADLNFVVSAKTGQNMENLFNKVGEQIISRDPSIVSTDIASFCLHNIKKMILNLVHIFVSFLCNLTVNLSSLL